MQVDLYCGNLRKHASEEDIKRGYGLHTYTIDPSKISIIEWGRRTIFCGEDIDRIVESIFNCGKCEECLHTYPKVARLCKLETEPYWVAGYT